jgi:hypothetical protein
MANDETTAEDKGSRSPWGFILWPLLIVVLYFLSSGPALRLEDKGIIREKLLIIYKPLGLVAKNVRLVDRALQLYLHLWCPNLADRDGHKGVRFY